MEDALGMARRWEWTEVETMRDGPARLLGWHGIQRNGTVL
jgi:hypothetical protein